MLELNSWNQPKDGEVLDRVVGTMDEPVDEVVETLEKWSETLQGMIPNFVVAFVVMLIFWGLSALFSSLARRLFRRISSNLALSRLAGTVVRWLTLSAGLLIALGLLQLDKTLTSLLAGAGVIGLALGFAFQNITANLLSGVLLSLRKPYGVGDIIRSNDHFGTVRDINLRTTDMVTPDGRLILIPNKDVFENSIENYSWRKAHRVDLPVGVSYGDDLEKARRVAQKAVADLGIHDESRGVEVLYSEFGSSSINFEMRFWVPFNAPSDELKAKSQAIIAIKAAFDEADISIPFPIRTLDFGIRGGATLAEMPLDLRAADSQAMDEASSPGEGDEES